MPRTAHRVADDEPLDERAAIVRTLCANGEQLVPGACQHDLLVTNAPENHAAIRQRRGGDTFRQVETRLLFCFAHGSPSADTTRNGAAPPGRRSYLRIRVP